MLCRKIPFHSPHPEILNRLLIHQIGDDHLVSLGETEPLAPVQLNGMILVNNAIYHLAGGQLQILCQGPVQRLGHLLRVEYTADTVRLVGQTV